MSFLCFHWTSYCNTLSHSFVYIVPDVAFVPQEKLEPLDLSCNTDITPVGLETTFHTERTSKEKEHLQLINYSSKALADGRIASTSSGKVLEFTNT